MRTFFLALLLFASAPARAGLDATPRPVDTSQFVTQAQVPSLVLANAPVTSVNGKVGAITTATLPGLYNVQAGGANPLPDPASVAGRYANACDVGGSGAGGGLGCAQLYSTGTCWRRTSPYVTALPVTIASSLNVTSLVQSSLLQITGAGFNTAAQINIANACPGDVFTLMVPNGVLGLLGSIGLTINGSNVLSSILGNGTWADYIWTGAGIQKVRGGTL